MKPLPPLLSALALAAGLLTALPAHAVGGLVDVNVIDRDSGATLPVYHHQGEWWIAGRPGARYAIEVRNAAPGRVLGVMAVDGVNVISGDTASWEQTGYVLARRQTAQITGWRKSDAEVAAFHFTALPQSYAARTGRPDHVGVIGVAVFREKAVPPPPPIAPRPWPRDGRFGGGAHAASADAAGPAGVGRVIYFDFDSFTVKPEYQGLVDQHARFLQGNRGRSVAVEGHTDERGSREYNLALGQKRAEAVRRALTLVGATDAQIEAVSFGEEKPAAMGASEDAYSQNRRVEIRYR